MELFVLFALFCAVFGGTCVWILQKNKKRKARYRRISHTKQAAQSRKKQEYPEEEPNCVQFKKNHRTGDLGCDGGACNCKLLCNCAERWFCRDVIREEIPQGYYKGQFWVVLPSGNRRIDFAIETQDGRRIAVELDGYTTHGKDLEEEVFEDQLLRQNELINAGWVILRFSFKQFRTERKRCRELLRALWNRDDVEVYNKRKDFVAQAVCATPNCNGQAKLLKNRTEGVLFWKCRSCGRTFDKQKLQPGR